MASVDHWHNREGSQCLDINTATRFLIERASKQIKGRTMRPQLPDLLATAIEEVLKKAGPAGRQAFDEGIVDAKFFSQLEKQFNRVQDRYYKRRQRRPKEESLLSSPVATPSEPAVELEQREQNAALRRAVEALPVDLKAVIEFELNRMRSDSLSPTPEEIQAAFGFSISSYRSRRRLAFLELRKRLEKDEAL